MKIWVDADACPKVIKEVLFRASSRTEIALVLVANSYLVVPPSKLITTIQVEHGFDAADNYIIQHMAANDLVITADIPLAAEVISHKGVALNPRGELYTENNVRQRLGMRDMMEQLRASGVYLSGQATLSLREKTAFANALDKILTKYQQQNSKPC